MTTIIQDFTLVNLTSSLVSLTSTMISQPVGLLLGAEVPSLPTYLTYYTLVSLCTQLFMHSSLYIFDFLLLCLYTHRKNIPLKYLFEIIYLSRHTVCYLRLSQYMARKFSCWLDAINALPLCGSQPCYQYRSE